MTYEAWCGHSRYLTWYSNTYNDWADRAKFFLLTNVARRVGQLSRQFYMGCGFHYDLEQQLGSLISRLAMPIQWNANWCEKIENDWAVMETRRVLVSGLVSDVVDAERSVVAAREVD